MGQQLESESLLFCLFKFKDHLKLALSPSLLSQLVLHYYHYNPTLKQTKPILPHLQSSPSTNVKLIDNKFTMNILTQRVSIQSLTTNICFLASKMQASSTQKTKDSAGRRLGLKVFGDQQVYPNDIIARQRGFKWKSGKNVIVGLDQTIHARTEGIVKFRISHERKVPFYYIDVEPKTLPNRKYGAPAPYNYHPQLFPERAVRNHPELVAVGKRKVKLQ